jgi:SAM-dependent methyltransferase
MRPAEAAEFLRPGVDPRHRVWADLGAGSGTFTQALRQLLGSGATIYAVDADRNAVARLQRLASTSSAATVVPVEADIADLASSPELDHVTWDAALLANVLHYFADPVRVLDDLASRIRPGGRAVLIEYDRTTANPWVPYPIPLKRAQNLASSAGLDWHGVVAQRPSRYHGTMYCGVLERK